MTVGEIIACILGIGSMVGAIVNLYVKIDRKANKDTVLQLQLDMAALNAVAKLREERLERIEEKLDRILTYENNGRKG